MTADSQQLGQWLRNAADGQHPTAKAAVLIVCHGVQSQLLDKLATAIETDPDTERAWINWPNATEIAQMFSGGERRLIALAASLYIGKPVDLADALTGLDTHNAELLAEALAQALDVDPTTGRSH